MSIIFDAEMSFVFLSNSIKEFPNLRKDFEEYYEKEKYRFYERARQSKYYGHECFSNNTLEAEVAVRRIYGILLCSEEDENIREYICGKLLSTNLRFRELIKEPTFSDMQEFITHAHSRDAKSYDAHNAPARFLTYLLYSTYGTGSENEVVNDYLADINEGNMLMSRYNRESYKEIFQFPKPSHVVVTKRVRTLIGKLRTGMDTTSFMDFREKEILGCNDMSINSELYNNIKDYFKFNNETEADTLRAIMIRSAVSYITSIYGVSLSGSFGQTSITKNEEDLLINILTASRLSNRNKRGEQEMTVKVSDYLLGFIIMLLAKEIRNMKEFYFRNNSETQYLELQRLETIMDEKDLEIERLKTGLSESAEHSERQKEEIRQLTDKAVKDDKEAVKPYKSEISGLNARIRELDRKLETEKDKTAELNALREFVFAPESDYILGETTVSLAETIRGKKIIIVGGHADWRSKMKAQYPAITFFDGHNGVPDSTLFERADFVLLCMLNMSHRVHEKVIKHLLDRKIRFGYLGRNTNQELFEGEIAALLQKSMRA